MKGGAMNYDKIIDSNLEKDRLAIAKSRLLRYGRNLDVKEGIETKIEILNDRLSIGGSWSDSEAVSGGGSKLEDKMVDIFDEISDHQLRLKRIELSNRAIKFALKGLSEDEKFIIQNIWMVEYRDRMSLRDVASRLHCSKSTVDRMNKNALLHIYKRLYLIDGPEVDVR